MKEIVNKNSGMIYKMNKLCSIVCFIFLFNFIKIRIYEIWLYVILKYFFDLINLIGLFKVVFVKVSIFLRLSVFFLKN